MSRVTCAAFAMLLCVPAYAADLSSQWPSWRGPNRDGISKETGLLKEWPKDGPTLEWRVEGLGGAYSSVAIAGGRIYTMGSRRSKASRRKVCQLIAIDLEDGKEIWATDAGGGNPNCTPTIDGDRVYGLDRNGLLTCCSSSDGKKLWQVDFRRDLGGKMMSGWGYSESPLIDGDRLICTPGAPDAIIAALDKKTGKVIWKAATPGDFTGRGRDGAAYSSIVISNAAGVKQYVQLTGRGVISVSAADGKPLWNYTRVANGTANIPTPLVDADYVFCSTGYGAGSALLKIEKSGEGLVANEQYYLSGRKLQNHHGGMVLLDGHVYCGHKHNQGFPICVDMKSGEVKWGGDIRGPGKGSAAVIYADGHLYFRYEDGVMALIEAKPDGYKLKSTFKLASHNGRSWPHPAIYNGRLYLRDQGTLLCYDIRAAK